MDKTYFVTLPFDHPELLDDTDVVKGIGLSPKILTIQVSVADPDGTTQRLISVTEFHNIEFNLQKLQFLTKELGDLLYGRLHKEFGRAETLDLGEPVDIPRIE